MTVNIGVLASGEGTNLQSLIDACESGRIRNGVIRVVISNKADAPALQRARKHGLDAVFLESSDYKGKRWEYDQLVIKALKEHEVTPEDGLVILAGYMRILSPEFVSAFRLRIMNIHPALLPAFPGLEAPRQALEYGAKVTGCTVHFVDEGVDTGPVIIQESVAISERDTVDSLTQKIHALEHEMYPKAVALFTENSLRVEGRRVKVLL